jgi:hypothetical protein
MLAVLDHGLGWNPVLQLIWHPGKFFNNPEHFSVKNNIIKLCTNVLIFKRKVSGPCHLLQLTIKVLTFWQLYNWMRQIIFCFGNCLKNVKKDTLFWLLGNRNCWNIIKLDIFRYPSSRSSTMKSFAVLYPETTVRSHHGDSNTIQSRSTIHSLRGVPDSVRGPGVSRQTSLNRDLSSNQLFMHQRRLSADLDTDLDFTTLNDADDDFGFRSKFNPQVWTFKKCQNFQYF